MCQLVNQQVTKPSTLSICGGKLEKHFLFQQNKNFSQLSIREYGENLTSRVRIMPTVDRSSGKNAQGFSQDIVPGSILMQVSLK